LNFGGSGVAAIDREAVGKILSVFVPMAGSTSIQSIRGGLSGSAVFKCECNGRKFALKRWPQGTNARRVDEVHAVMLLARRTLGIVPELAESTLASTRLGYEGYQYELASWMEGEALGDAPNEITVSIGGLSTTAAEYTGPSKRILAAVEAGAEAIARFHDSTRRYIGPTAPAPAVLRRLSRIEQLQVELPKAMQQSERLSPVLRAAAHWLKREWPNRMDAANRALSRWVGQLVPTRMVFRDVHRQHILFREGAVSGMVDFDAIGIDTIATDLARWVSGFSERTGDLEPLLQAAVTGYQRFAAISTCERDLAFVISEASGTLLLANWVSWVALGQRNFSECADLVDRRVGDLLRRMGVEAMIMEG